MQANVAAILYKYDWTFDDEEDENNQNDNYYKGFY